MLMSINSELSQLSAAAGVSVVAVSLSMGSSFSEDSFSCESNDK